MKIRHCLFLAAAWVAFSLRAETNRYDGSVWARVDLKQAVAAAAAITAELEASPTIVSPQDYPAILNVEAALGQSSGRMFLFEK